MPDNRQLDCVVIGYNESPFDVYEKQIRGYGEDSEAYRDLKFSFLDLQGRKLNYVDLLNHVWVEANGKRPRDTFISGEIPNLAAVYLASYLRRRGFQSEYLNLFQYERDELRDYLDARPLCVAITTTFYVLNFPVIEMVEFIRRHAPETKIVVGGPLVANHTRAYEGEQLRVALADLGADVFVVEGQGETTLAAIVEALRDGGDLSRVPNILYWEKTELKRTGNLPENNDLNAEAIDWTGFPGRQLGATIQTRTARSCAFKCSFCNYPTRAGALTLASLATIERELDSMRALGNVRNVVFIDDTFNVPLPRFKEICRLMIRKRYQLDWFSYFRCSNSDEEAFDLMAESGCKGVFLGIESGSPTILTYMDKHATIEKYAVGIEELHKRGVLTFGSFILGFPGETDETVAETLKFIRQVKPKYYRTQMWYNEPGTPIQRRRDEFNITGEGFVWEHVGMDSLAAMDHIDRLFLNVKESIWLPQWSFDFWIIPYLMGKGMSLDQFARFTEGAQEMLRLEIASVPAQQKYALQKRHLEGLVEGARSWAV